MSADSQMGLNDYLWNTTSTLLKADQLPVNMQQDPRRAGWWSLLNI